MTDWELVDNPAYAGREPEPLEPACHDRSPMLTVRCSCGSDMHFHETQIRGDVGDLPVGARCLGCGELLTFPPGYLNKAFAEMRRRGWHNDKSNLALPKACAWRRTLIGSECAPE